MELNVKITPETYSKLYLTTLNGTLKLTEKELDVCAAICDMYIELTQQGLREPFLSKFVFSAEGKKNLCERLGDISTTNLGNKLKILKEKKVLMPTEEGHFEIFPSLLPRPKVTFNFIAETNNAE